MQKSVPPQPRDYHEYIAMLSDACAGVMRNAADPARTRTRYQPLLTASKGCDAPSIMTLFRPLGARDTMTFVDSRKWNGRHDDDGTQIAERLGYRVTRYDRLAYRELPGPIEPEFVACPKGADMVMAPCERQLDGALLVTGRRGDVVLSPYTWRALPDLLYPNDTDNAGKMMTEFRLRVGFQHFTPFYTGAEHAPALRLISISQAMKPWSIGGRYDRPIARRLVEEAGVPRDWFGQVKCATANDWLRNASDLSPAGKRDYLEFRRTMPRLAAPRRAFHRLMAAAHAANASLDQLAGNALMRIGRRPNMLWVNLRYYKPIDDTDFMFHWGVDRIRHRYEVARQ